MQCVGEAGRCQLGQVGEEVGEGEGGGGDKEWEVCDVVGDGWVVRGLWGVEWC